MVEITDSSAPEGRQLDPNATGAGGSAAGPKRLPSITEKPIIPPEGTSVPTFSSVDAEPGSDVRIYMRHLEQKIDLLSRHVDRDNGVREELADIRRLLYVSTSSSRSGRARSRSGRRQHSPEKRPSAKDRIGPLHAGGSRRGSYRRVHSSVSASTTRSVHPSRDEAETQAATVGQRPGKAHVDPNPLVVVVAEEFQTKQYRVKKLKSLAHEKLNDERQAAPTRKEASPSRRTRERSPEKRATGRYQERSPKKQHGGAHTRQHEHSRKRERTPVLPRGASSRSPCNSPDRTRHSGKRSPSHRSGGYSRSNRSRRDERLARLSTTPFSPEIEAVVPPAGFTQPKFTRYEGVKEAYAHLVHYKHVMSLFTSNDALLCKVFPASLGDEALYWLNSQLPPRSITSFSQLCEAFMSRFVTSDTTEKETNHLLALKQRPDETLRQYASRFWALYNKIDRCDSKISTRGFKDGLTTTYDQVYDDLARDKPHSMKELMQRMDEWSSCLRAKRSVGG